MRLVLAFLVSVVCHAATITVCASGCDYSNFQAALNAAARGDIVQLTAGETFEGSFRLPYKSAGNGSIEIRSSRHSECPPDGTRVTSAHAAVMAKLQPPNTSANTIYTTPEERSISSVNSATDTITTSTHGYVDGEPIVMRIGTGVAPTPLVELTPYYVRDATGATFKLALTPGGAAIDLGATFSGDVRFQTQWSGSDYTFNCVEISKKSGQDTLYNLVQIGDVITLRSGLPRNFVFKHVYVHGIENEEGPNICMVLNGATITVVDSEISACVKGGSESKAISFWNSPGPLLIQNNTIEAGSINLLTGGDFVPIPNLVNGDQGGIKIIGNVFRKPFWMRYTSGTSGVGAPVGACLDDARYMRTSNGQWYLCSSSTWSTGPVCADDEYYRATDAGQGWVCGSGVFTTTAVNRTASYVPKNLLELKSNTNTLIQGNVYEQMFDSSGQDGSAIVLAAKVSQYNANAWVVVEDTVFANNIVRNSPNGMRTSTEGGTVFGVNNNRISAVNNLFHYIGTTQYPSISGTSPRGFSYAGPCDYCTFEHNTLSGAAPGGSGQFWDTAAFSSPRLANSIWYANQYGNLTDGGVPVSNFWGTGNIINSVGVDNLSSQGAPNSFGAYATNGKWITAATTLFVGGGDYRLQTASPYSASCSSGCDFTGTDGKDLGADIDLVEMATGGAVSGAPWMGGSIRVSVGSIRSVAYYTAPDSSTCAVKLFTNFARTTLATDTDSAPEQVDSRAGSITAGTSRQLVLGAYSALTASTQYYLRVACGAQVAVVPFATRAAGADTVATVAYGSATTGEYSANADMSSPTAISSSATHTIPISTGTVRYYRRTGGPIQVFVAP